MTTCGGALVGVEDVFAEYRRSERFVVAITESDERGNALGGQRPVDPSIGHDLLRSDHVGPSVDDGLREALRVDPLGEECTSAGDGGTLGGPEAITIKRCIGAIGRTTRIGPSQGETTEFDVFLDMANAKHGRQPERVALHEPTPTSRASSPQLRSAEMLSCRSWVRNAFVAVSSRTARSTSGFDPGT